MPEPNPSTASVSPQEKLLEELRRRSAEAEAGGGTERVETDGYVGGAPGALECVITLLRVHRARQASLVTDCSRLL